MIIKKRVLILIVIICLVVTGCSTNSIEAVSTEAATEVSEQTDDSGATAGQFSEVPEAKEAVEYEDYDSDACMITMNGDSVEIDGDGAQYTDGNIIISDAGEYVFSGILKDGSILVETLDDDDVYLYLNGVSITSSDYAAIACSSANNLVISSVAGTENSVSDGSEYTLLADDDETNAAIYSKCDLYFNGTGSLTVKGNYNNGITGKDELVICDTAINITSVDDGILGRDSLIVYSGDLVVTSGGDGMKATNDSVTDKGYIIVFGGNITINSENDGVQGVTGVAVEDGNLNIISGGGENVKATNAGVTNAETTNVDTTTEDESVSMKGIKSGGTITIDGGTITIDSADDTIHSNGYAVVNGGTMILNSGDDGIHADTDLAINGGTINVGKSYEGLEASVVTINDGDITVVASDDGINVAGGNDDSSTSGSKGNDMFTVTQNNVLTINGGNISVDASGDGLDSNGYIVMKGGTVYVSGPTDDANGTLDYNGTFTMDGGTLVAAGSSGMLQYPSDESAQCSITVYFDSTYTGGTAVTLTDADGNEIESYTPKKDYCAVTFSSEAIKDGETYTVTAGEDSQEITADGTNTVSGTASGRGGGQGGMGGQMGDAPTDGEMPGGGQGGKAGGGPGGQMPSDAAPLDQGSSDTDTTE